MRKQSLVYLALFAILMLSQIAAAQKTSGFAEINGGKIYYETAGKGKPVVFIHGGMVDSRLWDDQFERFAKNYRVIRYDIRGHGRSPMPAGQYSFLEDLRQLLNFLKIEKATLVGLSLGGVIAADFALEHPEMVEAMVLVGPGLRGFEQKPDEKGRNIYQATLKATPEEAAKMWLEHELLAGLKTRPREREKMLRLVADNYKAMTQIDGAKIYLLPQPPTLQRLDKIKAPTLVIIGDLDHPELIAAAGIIKEKVPGAEQALMKGVSHHPNLEEPKEFNKILQDFLKRKLK